MKLQVLAVNLEKGVQLNGKTVQSLNMGTPKARGALGGKFFESIEIVPPGLLVEDGTEFFLIPWAKVDSCRVARVQ